jgi:CspA family cold shock protein
MIGIVVWFNNVKGYGFLRDEATKKEYFVHYSAIQIKGYKKLEADQKVQFDIEKGPSGREQAANVVVVED